MLPIALIGVTVALLLVTSPEGANPLSLPLVVEGVTLAESIVAVRPAKAIMIPDIR